MQLTLAQAAVHAGKTIRQLRYLIQQERLPAHKTAGRWFVNTSDLPASEKRQASRKRKQRQLRSAVEVALELEPDSRNKERYSVRDLKAFQAATKRC